MSNIEHILENALVAMEEGKDFDIWVKEEESMGNVSTDGEIPMSYASFWTLADYVINVYKADYMSDIVEQLEYEKLTAFLTLANTSDEKTDYIYLQVASVLDRAIEIVKGTKEK